MQKHQPALLGGLFIGILSSLPVVNAANCCCLWVIAGGVLVTYLQQQRTPEPVETADVVIGGLLAGVIGAVIYGIIMFVMMNAVGGMMMQERMRDALENPDMPPEVRDMLTNVFMGRNLGLLIFAISLPVYAIFSMLGALLGLAFFRKKLPPQAPPPQA